MKTNSKAMAFVVLAMMLAGAFCFVSLTDEQDAAVNDTFDTEDGLKYVILTQDDELKTGTLSVSAQNATSVSDAVTIPENIYLTFDPITVVDEPTEDTYTFTVVRIPTNGFDGCADLTSVNMPDTITSMGYVPFRGTAIQEITIPASMTKIDSRALEGMASLTSVDFNNVTSIESMAFKGCTSLVTVEIPDTVVSIGGNAFQNCTALTTVQWPAGTHTIASGVFDGCTSLKNFVIPDHITSVSAVAFRGTLIEGITIPASMTEIVGRAFEGMASLTSVSIHDGVTSIGSEAFKSCTALTTINWPANTHTISTGVFDGCTSLENFVIPDHITSIQLVVFRDTAIKEIAIPDSVTTIGQRAFERMASLTSVDFNNVTSIESMAFNGCTSLETVNIPDAVVSIGNNAFQNCTALTTVHWPANTHTMNTGVLDGCASLVNFTIPDHITSIGLVALRGTAITEITIPASMTTIGSRAFEGMESLTSVNIHDGVTSIGGEAFKSCIALENIAFPASLEAIGSEAFKGTAITSVTFSNNVTIGAAAFYRTQVKSITFEGTTNTIDNLNAFPAAGYEYAGGAILAEWTPELTIAPVAGTYTATLAKGEPSSYEMYAVDGSISYKAGDAFNYEAISIQLNYEGFDPVVVSSADAGFEGISWYTDAECTEAYILGETTLSAGTVPLYFVYGTYAETPASIVLNVTDNVAYDPEKTIDEQLVDNTDLVIPSTADIKQDIALVANAQVLFEAGSKLTGSVSYADGNIKFVDAVFKYNTLIAAGSVKIIGDVEHGMVIFEGTDNVISADFTVGEGVVVIFKDGCAVEIEEGATFTIPAGAYYQNYNATLPVTGGTFVYGEATELVATDFINEDNNEVTGVDYTAGFRVDLTLSNDFVIDQSYTRTVFWYLVNQEDPSVVYHDSTTVVAGETNVSLYYNVLAQRGSYDLYMVVYRDVVVDPTVETEATVVAASSSITVNFIDEGWMIGLYIDDAGAYHAVVMNFGGDILEGAVTTNAYATVELDVGETDPITYVKAVATDLTKTIGAEDVDDVDFNMGSDAGVTGEIIGFQLRYDCHEQTDGFVMRSQQILDAGNIAAHESEASGNGALEAVLYFAMVDSDDDGTAETPVIYVYSAVDINNATITLWYNNGSDNESVTATISVAAGSYKTLEYSIFDAAYGDDFLADLLAGNVFLMSAYISAVDDMGTPDDTSDDVTNTTLEVISF